MADTTGFFKNQQGITIEKDPTANVAYTLDWSQYLPTNTIISSTSITIETISGDSSPLQHPTDAATDVSIITNNKVRIRVEGGTDGNVYDIACQITTDGGDIDTRHFKVVVKERNLI